MVDSLQCNVQKTMINKDNVGVLTDKGKRSQEHDPLEVLTVLMFLVSSRARCRIDVNFEVLTKPNFSHAVVFKPSNRVHSIYPWNLILKLVYLVFTHHICPSTTDNVLSPRYLSFKIHLPSWSIPSIPWCTSSRIQYDVIKGGDRNRPNSLSKSFLSKFKGLFAPPCLKVIPQFLTSNSTII